MSGFLAWLQSIGHTLKGWVSFMTLDEWIVLGMVIAALALAMTGTSVTRSVKRKRKVRKADAKPSTAAPVKQAEETHQLEEKPLDVREEPAEKENTSRQEEADQAMPSVAKNPLEETAPATEDDNLSVEGTDTSPRTSVAEAEETNQPEEKLLDEQEEPAREENYPMQEESQAEEARQAEPEPLAEQSEADIVAVPQTADTKPFKPKRESASSVAVSYEGQKQSRNRSGRREDISSLTGGGDPVAAKLNLARVYSDTGDSKEAQQLLQEVLKEGSEAQQRAAQAYLEKLQQREDT
ncbi:MAG: hypothetical protein GY821_03565 [Gammaproteobacteria bacterium]|nr:hypothetical protein [Gammaproteobacteria bacterium]